MLKESEYFQSQGILYLIYIFYSGGPSYGKIIQATFVTVKCHNQQSFCGRRKKITCERRTHPF